MNKCPVCGQTLPQGLTQVDIDRKMSVFTSSAVAAERKRFESEIDDKLAAAREVGRQRAEKQFQRELDEANAAAKRISEEKAESIRKLQQAHEKELKLSEARARSEAEQKLRRDIEDAQRKVNDAARTIEQARGWPTLSPAFGEGWDSRTRLNARVNSIPISGNQNRKIRRHQSDSP